MFFHRLIVHCQLRANLASVVAPASRRMLVTSSASRMENCGLRPRASPSSRSRRTPREWKVHTSSLLAALAPIRALTRSRISAAALLVKVMAPICEGARSAPGPGCSRRAILCVMTRVLPEPAPARTRQGLSRCCTAAIWAGFMVGAEAAWDDMGTTGRGGATLWKPAGTRAPRIVHPGTPPKQGGGDQPGKAEIAHGASQCCAPAIKGRGSPLGRRTLNSYDALTLGHKSRMAVVCSALNASPLLERRIHEQVC